MKTKNSNSSPKDSTQGLIRYLNYTLEFPDGERWTDYTHIAGGLNAWVVNTALWKTKPEAARRLIKTGEYHWKDNNGVLHRMVISEWPCERKWGLNKSIKRGSLKDTFNG